MIQEERATLIAPIGIGAGHVIFILGLLRWLGYPLDWLTGTTILQLISLILGLFLVAFIPVLLFARTQLVVPLGMAIVGFGIAIVAGLMTPRPEFATLGENVLVMGPTYVGAYANGWYVWLLAYGLGGVCEYVVRSSINGFVDPPEFSSWYVPLDRQRSILVGCVIGLAHTVVSITLGIEGEGMLLSGWLLGWGLLGVLLLGSIPILFLIQYQLISPVAGLITIQLAIGIEILITTSGTPVSSYMLFWPVYLTLMLLFVIGEYVLRRGYQKVR